MCNSWGLRGAKGTWGCIYGVGVNLGIVLVAKQGQEILLQFAPPRDVPFAAQPGSNDPHAAC